MCGFFGIHGKISCNISRINLKKTIRKNKKTFKFCFFSCCDFLWIYEWFVCAVLVLLNDFFNTGYGQTKTFLENLQTCFLWNVCGEFLANVEEIVLQRLIKFQIELLGNVCQNSHKNGKKSLFQKALGRHLQRLMKIYIYGLFEIFLKLNFLKLKSCKNIWLTSFQAEL